MSAHGMIFFSWWLLVITTWVKARMITGFSEGVLSSLLNHQQTQILLVVVIILIWMDTQPWYFHFSNLKHFLKLNGFGQVFLTVELCHMLSLLFIYVGGSCIFNSCTIHTDLFPTVTWSRTAGAEINGASLLDLQLKQAMGKRLWSWTARYGWSKYH